MTLYQVAGELGNKLLARQWKLVTAESCTAGGLSYWITSIDGSSTWFDRGYITYSNSSKCQMLGIEIATIEKYGAVSNVIALAMAKGALAKSGAQLSIAVTGVAGPTGGSPEKPVGTVWISVINTQMEPVTKHYLFQGSRTQIRDQAILNALTQAIAIL